MDIVIRAAVVYVFVLVTLRSLGKRELGELSAFELVLLFIVGDLVQQSITQDDRSITASVLAISTISMLILAQSYVTYRWRRTRKVVDGSPVLLVHDGHLVHDALRRERMTADDVHEAARQQGIADLGTVRVAILETGGKISFVTGEHHAPPPESLSG